VRAKLEAGAAVIDVRTAGEFSSGAYPKAATTAGLPGSKMQKLGPKDAPIIVYCASGSRSAQAARILKAAGFTDVTNAGASTPCRGNYGAFRPTPGPGGGGSPHSPAPPDEEAVARVRRDSMSADPKGTARQSMPMRIAHDPRTVLRARPWARAAWRYNAGIMRSDRATRGERTRRP
jgi:phage shock protein E